MKASNHTKKQKIVKRVCFSEHSALVLTRRNSINELMSLWYSKSQLKQFKQNARKSTQALLDSNPAAANAYIRTTLIGSNDKDSSEIITELDAKHIGIEHGLSPHVCKALINARSKVINDVLQEQARQKTGGVHDCTKLAAVSIRTSLLPKLWRHRIALVNLG
jgi:predicted HTH transcriptional regulator